MKKIQKICLMLLCAVLLLAGCGDSITLKYNLPKSFSKGTDGVVDENEKYELIKQVLNPYVGDLVVTPKEIDEIITSVSDVVAQGINHALLAEQI